MLALLSDGWQQVSSVLELLLPLTVATALLSLAAAGLNFALAHTPFWRTVAFLVPVALLGATSGLIAGASQEEVTGALLTGMLTLVAALLSYVFTRESLKAQRPFVPAAIAVLCIGVLVGVRLGGVERQKWDAYKKEYEIWEAQHKGVDVPAMLIKERYKVCLEKMPPPRRQSCEAVLTN